MDNPQKATSVARKVHKNPHVPVFCAPYRTKKTPKATIPQPQGMESRLHRLERLVTSLTKDGGIPQASDIVDSVNHQKSSMVDDSSQENGNPELGTMLVGKDESLYRGSTHWNDLTELRSTWNQFKVDMEAENLDKAFERGLSTKGPLFASATAGSPDRADLLASLPPKSTADKFIAKFFDPDDPSGPTLRKGASLTALLPQTRLLLITRSRQHLQPL
ncbi:hypothetical protein AJ79_07218 [Helicocarpus griseus UAMH5409]|uniref:Uncharacterized protein n=1 Tax=Helicocarpus griseus UAMH5409 TaxID=1447875 RepID=A0A2B7X4J9_9EURO|nr:hypothetical protein AJ79_07218 [Helicocarpus griseus UAMH5409]